MLEKLKKKIETYYKSKNTIFDLYSNSGGKINKIIVTFNSKYYLIDRRCPHNGLPLTKASINKEFLICNWHGCRFSLFPSEIIPRENIIEYIELSKSNFNWLDEIV